MDDRQELRAKAELVTKILFICKEYADKNGLDFLYVIQTTAEAMLKIIQ